VKTAPQLVPFASRPVSAQMSPEVSIVGDYRAGDAGGAGPAPVVATPTIGPDDLKASRPAQSALRTCGAFHNRLVRTTQLRLSRG
jgi:hypothetical protein